MILRPDNAETAYEISEVRVVLGDEPNQGVITFDRRVYKTSEAARRRERALQAEGKKTMFRVGITVWLEPERAAEIMQEIQRKGVSWL